jgi:hypothetical protein
MVSSMISSALARVDPATNRLAGHGFVSVERGGPESVLG